MSLLPREDDVDIRGDLLTAIAHAKERGRLGRQQEKLRQEAEIKLGQFEQARSELKRTIDHMTKMYKNIESYLSKKKEESLLRLKEAVIQAGCIVPDADTEGIQLVVHEKQARIVNKQGVDINLREGSAYRAVLGVLLRYTLLKFQPDALQVIFLDEAFATLSDNTASVMREVIDAIKDEVLVVGIEQRNLLYNGIDKMTLLADKDERKISTIRRVEE